jgi:hypothetical protein
MAPTSPDQWMDLAMINHQYRCVFIHIPKTAGQSVLRFFGMDWHNHKDLARYAQELNPGVLAGYLKCAVVRNPWDRLLSDYIFQKKKRVQSGNSLFIRDERGNRRSFRQWVETVLADPYRYTPAQWGAEVSKGIHRWSPQLDWVSLDGKIAMDKVLRMESLQADFAELRSTFNLPAGEPPCCNWRPHWHYSNYYDEPTRRLVETYYAKDIEAFGYGFEFPRGRLRRFLPERLATRSRSVLSSLLQARGGST